MCRRLLFPLLPPSPLTNSCQSLDGTSATPGALFRSPERVIGFSKMNLLFSPGSDLRGHRLWGYADLLPFYRIGGHDSRRSKIQRPRRCYRDLRCVRLEDTLHRPFAGS